MDKEEARPPAHPAIVHFPIALVIFSFLAELLGYLRDNAALRAAAFWSLVAAGLGAALAGPAGYIDMWRATLGEAHNYVHFHLTVGWVLLVAVLLLTLWRWRLYREPGRSAGRGYLAAAFLVLALTLFQGWYGGEMVYAGGAGVAAAGKGTEPADAGRKRLEWMTKALGGDVGHEHGEHGGTTEKQEDGGHKR